MSTVILICTGIIALIFLLAHIVVLAQIVAAIGNARETLDLIHKDHCFIHDTLVLLWKKDKPAKQREYWRDQNGFRHWRKKDA